VASTGLGNDALGVGHGDDSSGDLVSEEFEDFGRRRDAAAGNEVSANDFRISDMGPDGDTNFAALNPKVAYNGAANEYLVVWQGDANAATPAANEFEIFGQRLDAATGMEVGANDFRISDMGPDGNPAFAGLHPAVAYNPATN